MVPKPRLPSVWWLCELQARPVGVFLRRSPFNQKEMKKLLKAQYLTSETLANQRAHAKVVRFNLTVPEWAYPGDVNSSLLWT